MKSSGGHPTVSDEIFNVKQALKNSRKALWGVAFLSVIINLLMLTGPLYMLQVYDRVLASKSIPTLFALSLLMVGLYTFMWFFDHCRSRIAARIGSELDEDLSRATFSSWMTQGLYGGASKRVRPLEDLSQLRNFFSGQGPVAIFDLPWIPIYILVIFLLHWSLGVIAVVGTIIIVIAAIANEFSSRKPLQQTTQNKAKSLEYATRAHRNADALKAMGMQRHVQERWAGSYQDYSSSNLKGTDRVSGFTSFSKSFRMMLQSGVLGAGAALAVFEIVTPGTMIAASIIMGRALAPVQSALGQWRNMTFARQAYSRLNQFFSTIPQEEERLPLPTPAGFLTVTQAYAAPPGASSPTLTGINFELSPGQGLGIIGSAASGKSTLAKLLVGIWMPYNGYVRLDGATYSQWNADHLGPHIGYLPQTVELLDGTIGENISRFYPHATAEQIILAAKRAGIHDMILGFAEGYDSYIGEGGLVLSGGQVQRIALARALYGDPALIVLDEPNANLDSDGDTALGKAIVDLRKRGKTVVVVTHRPSALASLDMVLMLHQGKQVAFGSKDEVLNKVSPPKIQSKPKPFRISQSRESKPFSAAG